MNIVTCVYCLVNTLEMQVKPLVNIPYEGIQTKTLSIDWTKECDRLDFIPRKLGRPKGMKTVAEEEAILEELTLIRALTRRSRSQLLVVRSANIKQSKNTSGSEISKKYFEMIIQNLVVLKLIRKPVRLLRRLSKTVCDPLFGELYNEEYHRPRQFSEDVDWRNDCKIHFAQ
ncbi:hypothetical protein TcasGA2_TC012921 [Tribolium castaneum]|uniref:Uncharacterized protein n=1 Tax=Tribolium castaneum TaxID=7070 RepID=D6WC09_TRICA|nr:hypothetical protein TcasGA2_TC012921 [Tribolium castaneum]